MEKVEETFTPDHASYTAFKNAVTEASSLLPTRRPAANSQAVTWDNDQNISKARRKLQSCRAKHGSHNPVTQDAELELADAHARQAEAYVTQTVKEIESASANCRHGAAWKSINRLTGRKAKPNTVVAANSIEDRKQKMADHYKNVLNAPAPNEPLQPIPNFQPPAGELYNTQPLNEAEIEIALRATRPDTASGPDNIPPRILKLPELLPTITAMLNSSSCIGGDAYAVCPEDWKCANIVSIPKKGNCTALTNQRGISLMCSSTKLLNKCFLNRLLPVIKTILLNLQSGFLPGRSTVEQIASLRSIIDSCRTHQRCVSIVFVDFTKAFDTVCRAAIPTILSYYGVPSVLINAIMELYQGTCARVQTSHGPSDEFTTSSGVLQGDTLAPLLFVIILDYVLRHSLRDEDAYILQPRTCSRQPCVRISALAYADDIALMCSDPDAAQRTLSRLYAEGLKVGLKVSAAKTEVMHIGTMTSPDLQLPTGETISVCDDFKYLGAQVLSPDSLFADRRAQAWRAAHMLRPVFNSNATDGTKIRLFRATVESILLYSLETIPMTASREMTINSSFRRMLRFALGIHYPSILTNEELQARSGVPELSAILRRRRLMLVGHILREDARHLADGEPRTPLPLILAYEPQEMLRRGMGNYISLNKTLHEDAHQIGLTRPQIAQLNKNDFRFRVLSL